MAYTVFWPIELFPTKVGRIVAPSPESILSALDDLLADIDELRPT